MTKALFPWMSTNSMMGNDRWPFYGSLAVATHVRSTGADVEIFDRRLRPSIDEYRERVKGSDIVFLSSATSDLSCVQESLSICHEEGVAAVVGGVHPTALALHKSSALP